MRPARFTTYAWEPVSETPMPFPSERLASTSTTPKSILTMHVAVAPSSSRRHFAEKIQMSENEGGFPLAEAL